MPIVTIKHKGLKLLWTKGDRSKVEAKLADKIEERLFVLNTAKQIDDIKAVSGYRCHQLRGSARYSIWVDGNSRMTFEFRRGDVFVLDFEDYH